MLYREVVDQMRGYLSLDWWKKWSKGYGVRKKSGRMGGLRKDCRILFRPFGAQDISPIIQLSIIIYLLIKRQSFNQFSLSSGLMIISLLLLFLHSSCFHPIFLQQPVQFYCYILMLISLRKRQAAIPANDISADQSFAQSTVSKRFTRKKNDSKDHNNNRNKVSKAEQPAQRESRSKQMMREHRISVNFIKTEDLFIRIANTPTKEKHNYTPLSSDRTESTYPRSRFETESASFQLQPSTGKDCQYDLREELQLKGSEIMLLEDQVMRLKREAGFKEEENMKLSIRKEKEFATQLDKLKEQLRFVKSQLQEKTTEIRSLKKSETALNREIKSLKYEKLMLQKQLQQLYKKKLPKDMKDLMSFRELSLMKQVEDLKSRLQQSKTQHQLKLQVQLHRLKQENRAHGINVKNFQVHARIMNRKLMDCEGELRDKTENFSKCYLNMKESQGQLMEQLKKARKENIKLRRLHILSHSHSIKRINPHSSSQESLSLSLSSN